MHPSRAIALGFLVVSLLSLVEWGLVEQFSTTFPVLFLAVASGGLLVASIYGLVRYDSNPIVTEWGSTAYALLVGSALMGLAQGLSIVAHVL
jgi:hypothetical protein